MRRKSQDNPEQEIAEGPFHEEADGRTSPRGRIYSILDHKAVLCLILFIVSFSVFIPSLDNEFVWDDLTFVVESEPYLESFRLGRDFLLRKPRTTAKYYRPLFSLSLVTDYRVWGLSPFGYHLTNVLLHSACTLAFYFMLLILCREFKVKNPGAVAFLSSLLFALYPLHVETVSFVSARADIMAGALLFLCLGFYALSYRKLLYLLPAALCLFLSLYAKEVAYSFPIMLIGFDLISRRFFSRVNIAKYTILALLVSLYVLVRFDSFLPSEDFMEKSTIKGLSGLEMVSEFLVGFLGSYLYYGWKFIYPYDLNHFIDTIPGGDALHITLSVVLVAVVAAVCFISIKKRENFTAFSLLLLFATLGPAVLIAIFPVAITRFAERFMYIPSAGFCMLAGYIIVSAGRRSGIKWVSWALAGALCISYLVVTVKGQGPWQNSLTFWEAATEKSPDAMVPKINYGEALKKSGRTGEALEQYNKAMQSATRVDARGKSMATIPLAATHINRGNYDLAEKVLKDALKADPNVADSYNYFMGFISLKRDDLKSAKKYLAESLRIKWWNANAHYLMGSIRFAEAGEDNSGENYKLAEDSLKAALKINRNFAEARVLLARVYLKTGRKEEALAQAREALKTAKHPGTIAEARAIIGTE